MHHRPYIWYMDDEQERHAAFIERHGDRYRIRCFLRPEEVLEALEAGEKPDLLLSDIFFLRPERAAEAPAAQAAARELWGRIEEFRQGYREVYAPEGLELAARLRRERRGFPNVIYSSKAPLLLDARDFSRLTSEAGPVWIFKDHEDAETERLKLEAVLLGWSARRRYLQVRGLLLIIALSAAVVGLFLGLLLAPVL